MLLLRRDSTAYECEYGRAKRKLSRVAQRIVVEEFDERGCASGKNETTADRK